MECLKCGKKDVKSQKSHDRFCVGSNGNSNEVVEDIVIEQAITEVEGPIDTTVRCKYCNQPAAVYSDNRLKKGVHGRVVYKCYGGGCKTRKLFSPPIKELEVMV